MSLYCLKPIIKSKSTGQQETHRHQSRGALTSGNASYLTVGPGWFGGLSHHCRDDKKLRQRYVRFKKLFRLSLN